MAKVQIKSEKLTPFGGIFSIMEQFDSMISPFIDQALGQRWRSIIGYQYSEIDTKAYGIKKTSRIKAFVFSFISVPAKWIMTARQYVLNIYTENRAYARPFITEFG